jgi:hypothetical protein
MKSPMANMVEKIIFANFDLPLFIEQYANNRLQKIADGKFKSACPFPFHKDKKPSFSIDFKDGGWYWYCYGCGTGGTAVQFFQKYYGIDYNEAIERICKVGNITVDLSSYLKSMSSVVDTSIEKKQIENDHIDICIKCRNFMRDFPGDREAVKWAKVIYDKANKILETMNTEEMRKLFEEVNDYTS